MIQNGSPWWNGQARDVRRKERVFVAVPTMDNRVTIQLHSFVAALISSSSRTDTKYHFQATVVNDLCPVEYARNYLVQQFLETDCERLWFLDADMMPGQETLDLLETDGDVVCARMFRFQHADGSNGTKPHLSLCAFLDADTTKGTFNPVRPTLGDVAVQDVDALGTGCTLIRRKVFEDSRMLLPTKYLDWSGQERDLADETSDPGYVPPYFRTLYLPNGRRLRGEDVDFVRRAKDLGYSVRVNLAATCGHFKNVDLDEIAVLVESAWKSGAESQARRVAV